MINEILASTVAAAIVTSIVNYFIKRFDYQAEYNKKILEKRIQALAEVESFVQALKISVLDHDSKPYHLALTRTTGDVHNLAASASVMAMWISERILEQMRLFNQTVFGIPDEIERKIEFAKVNYVAIAELRHKIEKSLMEEYLGLPNVRAFLKMKSKEKSGYRSFKNIQAQNIEPATNEKRANASA